MVTFPALTPFLIPGAIIQIDLYNEKAIYSFRHCLNREEPSGAQVRGLIGWGASINRGTRSLALMNTNTQGGQDAALLRYIGSVDIGIHIMKIWWSLIEFTMFLKRHMYTDTDNSCAFPSHIWAPEFRTIQTNLPLWFIRIPWSV